MAGRTPEQAGAARESVLTATERLSAERGVHAVSDRQIGEAAGQGDNSASGTPAVRADRDDVAAVVSDAPVGLWSAPVTR